MNYTISEENYLKTIFHLQQDEDKVSTNQVAEVLQTSAASVTDMMKKLHAKKLLHYKKYYGFSLSTEGKKIALGIVRRHRLWEFFLAEKLGFGWNEVHQMAEELEHVSHQQLIDRLDQFLGRPQFDPHGDPIPDSKGKMPQPRKIPLSSLQVQQVAVVCQVTNQSAGLLEVLKHKKIGIGTRLQIRKRFSFDESYELKIGNHTTQISKQLAKNIFVRYEQNL